MQISKEKFNELNQLDRIEYRQRFEGIKKRYSTNYFFSYCLMGVIIMSLLIISILSLYNTAFLKEDKDTLDLIEENIDKICSIFMGLFAIGLFFALIVDFINISCLKKYRNELEEIYFKVDLKNKNGRRK